MKKIILAAIAGAILLSNVAFASTKPVITTKTPPNLITVQTQEPKGW
jgi:hypothetical protein